MNTYFNRLPPDAAVEIERLSRLGFELRESRRALLQPYGVEDESSLLQRMAAGEVEEHPAYEHYLGALALEAARADIHGELKALLRQLGG